ncbi:MAG: LysE family transporter [Pseudomonadota bacterium]
MFFAELITVAVIILLGCMSPGPDFVAVTSHALSDRAKGLWVALGAAIAISIWAALAVFGLDTVLSVFPWLYDVLRFGGAAYLVWLGGVILWSTRKPSNAIELGQPVPSTRAALWTGLLVGLANPKTAVFFGSIFLAVFPSKAPFWVHLSTVIVTFAIALIWFSAVATLFSIGSITAIYSRFRRLIDRFLGLLLIGLALRVAFW